MGKPLEQQTVGHLPGELPERSAGDSNQDAVAQRQPEGAEVLDAARAGRRQ
ncbi:hypothetical protein [Pontiella sulfatireligans]|uniref:hypothetical protein n=1 Tax=Pontiella sulfatireligans TaxID=2750658 RepID=UPI0014446A77|nr:hypothetical protein [Pontiella sulfatireligans]